MNFDSLHPLYPLLFEPVYKDYIWGGDRIPRQYGRSAPSGIIAESWEIADRLEGMSTVINGSLAGKTLHQLIQDYGFALLGRQRAYDTFPLLIKIIDAKQRLSVQVHPDEESADKVGGDPKTEMWYVLDAEQGAVVYAGLKPGVDKAAFQEALNAGKVEELLQAVPVSHGNVIYIPGGLVHAIGEGCLLLEIQQNSNTTYRVYDWERVGHDGKPRELHIDKAMRVIHWDDIGHAKRGGRDKKACSTQQFSLWPAPPAASCGRGERFWENAGVFPKSRSPATRGCGGMMPKLEFVELLNCAYFRVERIKCSDPLSCSMDGRSFHVLFVENGSIRIKTESSHLEVQPGTTVLMPASVTGYELAGLNVSPVLLRISLP